MKSKQVIKSVTVLFSLVLALSVQAAEVSQEIPYYGEKFYQDLHDGATNEALVASLRNVLLNAHVPHEKAMDELVAACADQEGCYSQKTLGYNNARVWMFGTFYLKADGDQYEVKDVYCDSYKTVADFKGVKLPGPGIIPDGNIINTEHTWPQSKFNPAFPEETQKSDLHHIYPTDNKLNGIRGNQWFGDVTTDTKTMHCKTDARFGMGEGDTAPVFQPPQDHKGHAARALFYFSLRYDLRIPPAEEVILRKWNQEHPVDEEEARRNEEIFKIQGNRNPFVDYPNLIDQIADF